MLGLILSFIFTIWKYTLILFIIIFIIRLIGGEIK